jgi:hypothetical protein
MNLRIYHHLVMVLMHVKVKCVRKTISLMNNPLFWGIMAIQSVESQLTLQRNMLTPASRSKNKPNMKPA